MGYNWTRAGPNGSCVVPNNTRVGATADRVGLNAARIALNQARADDLVGSVALAATSGRAAARGAGARLIAIPPTATVFTTPTIATRPSTQVGSGELQESPENSGVFLPVDHQADYPHFLSQLTLIVQLWPSLP